MILYLGSSLNLFKLDFWRFSFNTIYIQFIGEQIHTTLIGILLYNMYFSF